MSVSSFLLPLTKRQKQIAICLIQGMSTKEIARELKLAMCTVREHQALIKKKLTCKNPYQVGYKLAVLFSVEMNQNLNVLCLNPYF